MFFRERITAIRRQDKVLEIGPGATPHPRSNAFLELKFNTVQERISQRGNVTQEPSFGKRPIHYYDGKEFPFATGQFDYVICSHVIEHVADPTSFIAEVLRVGSGRGYLEYPLITCEYLYDFDVHLHFIKFDFEQRVLRFMPKCDTSLSEFAAVSSLLNKTLGYGWDELCAANKPLFFEGIEFNQPFAVEKTNELGKLLPLESLVVPKKPVRKLIGQLLNKLGL
jgi:SAM-dependent methyltransferase